MGGRGPDPSNVTFLVDRLKDKRLDA